MRKKFLLFVIFIPSCICLSQSVTTGLIDNLRDGFGVDVTYVGEIKNKLPNGFGLFIYRSSGNAIRHAGYFVNGLPEGRGVLLYKNGIFSGGFWKKGKLNGYGANVNKDGDFYAGDFVNHMRDGKGWYIFRDNGILCGSMVSDKINGRSIFIGNSGTIICDNIYRDGVKNGLGFQYETENRKTYEGEWAGGEWKQSGTAYNSFIKNSKFYGEKSANQVLAGILNDSKKQLNDTGFVYLLKEKKRYFGVFKEGQFLNGAIIKDDSSRFVGSLNNKGASGYCSFYRVDRFYTEGNYVNDFLNGPDCLSIDLKKSTVYYGNFVNGELTGKASFSNSSNEIYVGDYLKGDFTGEGFKVFANGYCVKGSWKAGVCTSAAQITNDKGAVILKLPKTIADGIAILANAGYDNFNVFEGEEQSNDYGFADSYYKSLLGLPGSLKKDAVIYDFDDYPIYFSPYAEELSFEKAVAKYNEVCRQVLVAKIILKPGAKAETLTGEIKKPGEGERTSSSFLPANLITGLSDIAVHVFIYPMGEDKYGIALVVCDPDSYIFSDDDDEDWYMF